MDNIILKTIVGSQAHGLATPESDFDYRGVFVTPTSEILSVESVGKKPKTTSWIEGKEDDTSYELGHFLHLATKCNPSILEVFTSPLDPRFEHTEDGMEMRDLFTHIWNSKGVHDAFLGYSHNQRKKYIENKDNRAKKYACAYLRTLYNGTELLTKGSLTANVGDSELGDTLRRFKAGESTSVGEVIDVCTIWEQKLKEAYEANPDKQTNYEVVNDYLIKMRKKHW